MISNIDVIKKIHSGIDQTCYAGLLKSWRRNDFDDKTLSMLHQKHRRVYSRIMCDGTLEDNNEYNDERMYDIMLGNDDFFAMVERLINIDAEDSYFSLNSFWKTKKSTEDVRHLNAIVLDFDFYKINKYKKLSPKDFYESYIQEKLPFLPTAVMDSGRGLYVIFSFKHCSYHLQELYRAICKALLDRFAEYGMDPKALNVTQVIRIPGTINTKTFREVKVLEFNDTDYTIQELSSILKYNREEVFKYKRKNKKKLIYTKKSKGKNVTGRKKHFQTFYNDCVKLIKIRNEKKQIVGIREYLLFVVRERAVFCGYTVEESIQIAFALNDLFSKSLNTNEVINRCRPSARPNITSLAKIITNLGIDEEEMQKMVMLKTKKMKMSDYQKRKRKHTLLNLTQAELKRFERRKTVLFLRIHKKMNVSAIARELKITRATVQADLKYIKENPSKFMIRLEEHLKNLNLKSRKQAVSIIKKFRKQFTLSIAVNEGMYTLFDILRNRHWRQLLKEY